MSWNPGFSASCTYPTIPTLMFEAAEPTSQPFNTDLPERAPSAARLAAEAFFAPAPGSSSETAEPAVLVKKSKLEEPSPAVSGEMPEPAEPPREPRVFRLSAPAAAADQATAEAPVTLGTVEPVAAVTESQSSEKLLPAPRSPCSHPSSQAPGASWRGNDHETSCARAHSCSRPCCRSGGRSGRAASGPPGSSAPASARSARQNGQH